MQKATMTAPHPLDRPIWSSLTSGWSEIAQGAGAAMRLDPDYGPFGAAADLSPNSQAAMTALIPPGGELWVVEEAPAAPPPGTCVLREATLAQMVANTISPVPHGFSIRALRDQDGAAMLDLALRTVPGPFARRTHRLGQFVGIEAEGRLVAMAGERMRMPGYTEVSGVCTDPDHRGRGYAGALMRHVALAMLARGETPCLHAYASHSATIALYETLGFRLRRTVQLTVLARAPA